MTDTRFRCDDPTRRALLVGLGAGAPLAFLMATRGGAVNRARRPGDPLTVADLLAADGDLDPARLGTSVTVRGFMAPALRHGVAFDVYERTTSPCLACGLVHDPGRSIAVIGAPAGEVSPLRPTVVSGRLGRDGRGAPAILVG